MLSNEKYKCRLPNYVLLNKYFLFWVQNLWKKNQNFLWLKLNP